MLCGWWWMLFDTGHGLFGYSAPGLAPCRGCQATRCRFVFRCQDKDNQNGHLVPLPSSAWGAFLVPTSLCQALAIEGARWTNHVAPSSDISHRHIWQHLRVVGRLAGRANMRSARVSR